MDPNKFISFQELRPIFGIPYSRMQIWRFEKSGKFPVRTVLSINRKAWRAGEILEWMKDPRRWAEENERKATAKAAG